MEDLNRQVSVILSADIVGYTSMMQEDEEKALLKLQHFENAIHSATKQYHGEIIKTFGDGCLVLFASAVNAASCSLEIQKQLRGDPYVPLRIGIHIGELVRKNHDVFGDGVNIASRIESMGVGNSILMSAVVREQLRNHQEFETKMIGSFSFKNVGEPIDLFALSNLGLKVPNVKEMKGKGKLFQSPIFSNKPLIPVTVAVVVILIVILVVSNVFNSKNDQFPTGNPKLIKMAVLPLINLNQTQELDYFSVGVTQEIIDELAKINQFQISAFSSTRVYKETDKSLQDIASELSVSMILSGSSRIHNDSVRLSLELINPESNARIWSSRYDDLLSNSIQIQNDIAKKVAAALNVQLSTEEEIEIDGMNTQSFEAYNLFLQARAEFSPAGKYTSVRLLKKSIQLDPNYAQAYTQLAWYSFMLGNGGKYTPFDSSPEKMRSLIETAMELDSTNSDNYLIMGALDLYWFNDLEEAKRNIDLALEINSWPKIPTNLCICSALSVYITGGDLVRASELVELSKKIDPSNTLVYLDEALIQLLEGKDKLAIESYRRALTYTDRGFFRHWVGWANYHTGNYQESINLLEIAASDTLNSFIHHSKAFLSVAYLKTSNAERSAYYHNLLIELQSEGARNISIPLAMIAAAQRNDEKTFHYLDKAYNEKDYGFAYLLNIDPVFDHLRDNPQFIELLKRPPFKDFPGKSKAT